MPPTQKRRRLLATPLTTATTTTALLLVASSTVATAFTPVPFLSRTSFTSSTDTQPFPNCQIRGLLAAASFDDYTVTEVDEMEQLILSVAAEPTDESRRDRLQAVFLQELAKPNAASSRFSHLFDQTLIVVGDRVKLQAQQKALQLQQEDKTAQDEFEDDALEDITPAKAVKTEEEQQLWALIDMMVQSKTIVKRESGELGNNGTFA